MFEHPGHPTELWDHVWAAKHVRESKSDLEIVPTGPKLKKMRKSKQTEENKILFSALILFSNFEIYMLYESSGGNKVDGLPPASSSGAAWS